MQKSIPLQYAAAQLCCLRQLTLTLSDSDQEIFWIRHQSLAQISSQVFLFFFLLFDLWNWTSGVLENV